MHKNVWVAKLQATAISFGVWAVTAVILTSCAAFLWYPGFLFWTDGGLEVTRLILGIDVILGPMLMFVIFSPTKSTRIKVMDFVIVISIQLGALVYGLYQVHEQAPAVVVFSETDFHPIRPGLLALQKASAAEFESMSPLKPPMLFSIRPTGEVAQQVLNMSLRQQIPTNAQVVLFRPLKANAQDLFRGDKVIRDYLHGSSPAALAEIDAKSGAGKGKLVWFVGRYGDAVLAFDTDTRLLGYVTVPTTLQNPVMAAPILTSKGRAAAAAAAAAASGAAASPAQSASTGR
jgi:hypothetical protein